MGVGPQVAQDFPRQKRAERKWRWGARAKDGADVEGKDAQTD